MNSMKSPRPCVSCVSWAWRSLFSLLRGVPVNRPFLVSLCHIFVKQEKDGVIYQSLLLPGDYSGIMHNYDAYESKDKYVSSGFLNVTVSPSDVKVDYIATTTDKSMAHGKKNGESIFSYTVKK